VQRYLHPCWLMLLIGLLCGSLSTWLYLGWKGADVGMGQGLKTLLHVKPAVRSVTDSQATNQTKPAAPKYDFYTRLLKDTPTPTPPISTPIIKKRPVKTKPQKNSKKDPASTAAAAVNRTKPFGPGISYMLQAGSYPNFRDADQLRANLALAGLESHIEKASIRGKGYYRVRLGPYFNTAGLRKTRKQLLRLGVAAEKIRQRRPATRNTN